MGGGDSCPGPGRAPGVLLGDLRRGAGGCRSPRREAREGGRRPGSRGGGELHHPWGGGRGWEGWRCALGPGGREMRESAGAWGWERLGSEYLGMGLAGDLRARLGIWQEPWWV